MPTACAAIPMRPPSSVAIAARERRDEPALLLRRAESEDRQRARARVNGDRDPDPGVGARELLEHEHVREEVGAAAAVLLGDADAEQTDLGEPLEQRPWEPMVAVPLRCVRLDLVASELARERLDLPLLRG